MSTTAPIIQVNLARGFRGGERQTLLLTRELAARGIPQRLIVRAGSPLLEMAADLPGLELHALHKPFWLHTRAVAGGALIHAHDGGKGLQYAALAGHRQALPWLITRRVDNPPGKSWLSRRRYERSAGIVAISQAVRGVVEAQFPGRTLAVIPSAHAELPQQATRIAELRARWPDKFLVGHVGALDHAQKGQEVLLEVARDWQQRHPQVQFLLVGDGPDRQRFETLSADLPNVSLIGQVDDVGNWLGAFDLFVFPSLHEGLGSTLLDALHAGLACLASDVDGIPEIVTSDREGLLVPPGDAGALGRALEALVQDERRRQRMSTAARRRAADFSAAAMAEAYLPIYRQLRSGG